VVLHWPPMYLQEWMLALQQTKRLTMLDKVKDQQKLTHQHGKISPLGFWNWITTSSLKMLTSSIPGIVFTPILFKVLWSLLSSVVVVLWTAFFFLPTKIPHTAISMELRVQNKLHDNTLLLVGEGRGGATIFASCNYMVPNTMWIVIMAWRYLQC